MMRPSDRLFLAVASASLLPAGAIAFALVRGTQDVRAALVSAPAPVAGLCRQAVVYTLDPFAHVAYFGFAAAALVAVALGMAAGFATHLRTRSVLRGHLVDAPVPERLKRLAAVARVRRVRVITSPRPLAFAFGYLAPSVAVSDTLLRALNDAELEALLLHEAEHVRHRDPLRLLIVATLSRAFLLAPLIDALADRFRIQKEIDADLAVIRDMGSRDALVSALLSAGAYASEGSAAGFADALSARIASLEGEELPRIRTGWKPAVTTSLMMFVIAAGLFVIATGAVDARVLHVCA